MKLKFRVWGLIICWNEILFQNFNCLSRRLKIENSIIVRQVIIINTTTLIITMLITWCFLNNWRTMGSKLELGIREGPSHYPHTMTTKTRWWAARSLASSRVPRLKDLSLPNTRYYPSSVTLVNTGHRIFCSKCRSGLAKSGLPTPDSCNPPPPPFLALGRSFKGGNSGAGPAV